MNSPATQAAIDKLVKSTGKENPIEAIRYRARELITRYKDTFGEPSFPIDVRVLASLRGIELSDVPAIHSPDAELVPDASTGRVTMRINPNRPEVRQRFSIAHEISHTFFPEYQNTEWCRTDARFRSRKDPDQFLEQLCDIGASELLLPIPWFSIDGNNVSCASDLVELASKYHGSLEATLRRHIEVSALPIAVVFFVWKLKPAQKSTIGNPLQSNLFGISPEDQRQEALQLRIEYTIASDQFKLLGHYLPNNKSLKKDGPIYKAASERRCVDGQSYLDIGSARGMYSIMAIPLWTGVKQVGPRGECNVAALLRPMSIDNQLPKRKPVSTETPSLFD